MWILSRGGSLRQMTDQWFVEIPLKLFSEFRRRFLSLFRELTRPKTWASWDIDPCKKHWSVNCETKKWATTEAYFFPKSISSSTNTRYSCVIEFFDGKAWKCFFIGYINRAVSKILTQLSSFWLNSFSRNAYSMYSGKLLLKNDQELSPILILRWWKKLPMSFFF